MAAPNFPDNRGGAAALAPPARDLGIAEALEAQSNLILRFTQLWETQNPIVAGAAGADQARANIDLIIADATKVKTATQLMTSREKSTRTLQPLTRVPAVDYGHNADVAAIRLYSVKTFDGTSGDTGEVTRWLSRILSLAQTHALTLAATVTLLVNASNGEALDFIYEMQEDGKSLGDIVRGLELRYGELCLPEEAVVKCNMMQRLPTETLINFLDRLRRMAKMAKRMIADNDERKAAIDSLIESNMRRVLPTSVRNALEERILARMRSGLPAFSVRELEKECVELEKRREERQVEILREQKQLAKRVSMIRSLHRVRSSAPADPNQFGASIRASDRYWTPDYNPRTNPNDAGYDSPEDLSPEEFSDLENQGYVHDVRYQKGHYGTRGRPYDRRKITRKVIEKHKYANYPKVAAAQEQAGPPIRMPEPHRMSISEMLQAANCSRGECIHCGCPGHLMRQDACALRGKPVVDRACPACRKGLHAADDCPRVFQKRTGAIQFLDEDSDDLND